MSASVAGAARGADVIRVPPPLMFGASFALGLLLQQQFPLTLAGRPATAMAGVVVLAGGIAAVLSGVVAVHRAGTTIVPHHLVSVLLTDGPYALTRNPMYAGLAVAVTGGALLAGSWWPIVLLPVSMTAVQLLVIGPEERYLASRFGDRYATYRATVRRWI